MIAMPSIAHMRPNWVNGSAPVARSSWFRERELAEVKRLLDRNRLVTLHGPAGVGKTRLAIQATLGLIEDMPHGVWWVGLTPLCDSAYLAQTMAGVFGVRDQPGLSTVAALTTAFH